MSESGRKLSDCSHFVFLAHLFLGQGFLRAVLYQKQAVLLFLIQKLQGNAVVSAVQLVIWLFRLRKVHGIKLLQKIDCAEPASQKASARVAEHFSAAGITVGDDVFSADNSYQCIDVVDDHLQVVLFNLQLMGFLVDTAVQNAFPYHQKFDKGNAEDNDPLCQSDAGGISTHRCPVSEPFGLDFGESIFFF